MAGSENEQDDQYIPEDDQIINVEVTSIKRKRSAKRQPSGVWDHFEKVKLEDGQLKAKCRYCSNLLSRGGNHGTNHLKYHSEICRPDKKLKSPMSEPVFDQDFSRKVLAWCCIKHKYPFSIGDHPYFKLLLKSLNPNFNVPCRNTIRSDCIEVFEDEKLKGYEFLGKLECKVTLTTDIWTAEHNGAPYIVVTAHFIDDSWTLQKKVLSFREFPSPHDGESLFTLMKEVIIEWNLEKKLYSIVVDNATNNDVMVRFLVGWLGGCLLINGDLFHIRCSAHILNLVVQDGLEEARPMIGKVRDSVRYLKKSVAARTKFKSAKNLLGLDHLKEVAMDVPNRWNSTFDLLDTALPLRNAFLRLAILDKKYKHNPEPEDWDNAEKLHNCLLPFYNATRHFSGRKYPTSNVFFPEVCMIHMKLLQWKTSEDAFMRDMCEPMLEKFTKYWEVCNLALAVAVVFDPRYKLKGVEFYYSKIYDKDDSDSKVKRVRDCLNALYVAYGGVLTSSSESSVTIRVGQGYDEFDEWCGSTLETKSELDLYLEEGKYPTKSPLDVLQYWATACKRFIILGKMARDILAVPATTVASEAAFSVGGRVITATRNRINPDAVEAIVAGDDWIQFLPEKDTGASDSECEEEFKGPVRFM